MIVKVHCKLTSREQNLSKMTITLNGLSTIITIRILTDCGTRSFEVLKTFLNFIIS